MARETKVGLIVGLGVILFVSIFVSDYLSTPESAQGEYAGLADFQNQTTNQPELLIRPSDVPDAPIDPGQLAAVSLERIERAGEADTPAHGPVIEPPFRRSTDGLTGLVDNATPTAIDPRADLTEPEPIGSLQIDDPSLAQTHQLDGHRIGPGDTQALADLSRVEIPEPPAIIKPPRQVQHTVRAGENLTMIARRHYDGDGNMWRSIRDANPGQVGPNGEVLQGAVLVIPKRSTEARRAAGALAAGPEGNARPNRPRVRMVTVRENQTLSAIAYEHLGSANKWPQIMAVNPELKKPEHLREGMKLRIPAEDTARLIEQAETARSQANRDAAAQTPGRTETNTYTVKPGDNLSKIAQKTLGDAERYDEIYKANKDKLSSADAIRVGMKLELPER